MRNIAVSGDVILQEVVVKEFTEAPEKLIVLGTPWQGESTGTQHGSLCLKVFKMRDRPAWTYICEDPVRTKRRRQNF